MFLPLALSGLPLQYHFQVPQSFLVHGGNLQDGPLRLLRRYPIAAFLDQDVDGKVRAAEATGCKRGRWPAELLPEWRFPSGLRFLSPRHFQS